MCMQSTYNGHLGIEYKLEHKESVHISVHNITMTFLNIATWNNLTIILRDIRDN